MEISFLNNIKKYSSVNDKTGIANVMNEAFREAEKFKNNVNNDLTGLNKVLVREIDVLKRQYEETKVGKTSKDIMTVVSSVQTGDFEARSGIDLTYLLPLEEWEEHYRKNLRFLQEKFGENAKCIYAVIHYDESTPHLHTAWAFSEKNTNEINYKKVENALTKSFKEKNQKKLKPNTKEYKEAFKIFSDENREKVIERQREKLNKEKDKKKYKFELGTSVINPKFLKEFHKKFSGTFALTDVIKDLQKKIEVFSNEKCEVVTSRTEKYNNSENLDKAKMSIEKQLERLENKIKKNEYTEADFNRYMTMSAKTMLVEEKKAISKENFFKKFKEIEADFKSRKIDKNITEIKKKWNLIKICKDLYEKNKKNKSLSKRLKEELKIIEKAVKNNVNLEEIKEIIDKSERGESAKNLIYEKEQLKREIGKAEMELKNLNKKIMEQSRYDDKLNGQIYKKQLELGEFAAKVEAKKKEAEKPVLVSRERIRELEKEAVEKAEAKAKIEIDKIKKEIEKKNAELENLEKIRREREKTQNQEIENYRIFKEQKEKEIKEWQVKTIDERVKEYIKATPVTDDDIDNFVLKYPNEYEALVTETNKEIKEILKDNHKQASDKIINVFSNIARQKARTQGKKISELEAIDITIKAIIETPKNSDNWLKELGEKINLILDERTEQQNAIKRPNLQEIGTRQGKTR
ncbi:hypothetical protein [Leptotrichia shahii]|uniref:plasmid recombination protein n=1 Tax=Leptotrichia shahii TaxID=157691 RepID=UPI0028D842B4|nr:hypothetical protein [Leptotrichia shahii]